MIIYAVIQEHHIFWDGPATDTKQSIFSAYATREDAETAKCFLETFAKGSNNFRKCWIEEVEWGKGKTSATSPGEQVEGEG